MHRDAAAGCEPAAGLKRTPRVSRGCPLRVAGSRLRTRWRSSDRVVRLQLAATESEPRDCRSLGVLSDLRSSRLRHSLFALRSAREPEFCREFKAKCEKAYLSSNLTCSA